MNIRTSNFSNEAIFTFSAYHTTWPQITFDLDMWDKLHFFFFFFFFFLLCRAEYAKPHVSVTSIFLSHFFPTNTFLFIHTSGDYSWLALFTNCNQNTLSSWTYETRNLPHNTGNQDKNITDKVIMKFLYTWCNFAVTGSRLYLRITLVFQIELLLCLWRYNKIRMLLVFFFFFWSSFFLIFFFSFFFISFFLFYSSIFISSSNFSVFFPSSQDLLDCKILRFYLAG